ncbi:MAG: AMP-binding protein [Actinomycetota bacterium]
MNLIERMSAPDDRLAIISGAERVHYGELRARADAWRGALAASGVAVGERVVLAASNDTAFATAYLAVVGLGAVVVPVNPQSPESELARELALVGARAAVVGPGLDATAAALSRAQPDLEVHTPGSLDASEAPPAPVVDVGADAVAVLLFTTGTAGMPKPAVLTHGNLDTSVRSMLSLPLDLAGHDHVIAGVIPLFHVFGLNTVLNLGFAIGATVILEDFSSPARLAALCVDHQVTVLGGPPNLWLALASAPDVAPESFTSVSMVLSGAAKLDSAVHAAVRERLGLDVSEGYGLTETSALLATALGTEAPVGSVGTIVPGLEVRVVDASGGDAFVGDPGEVWARGAAVSPGYFDAGDGGTAPLGPVADAATANDPRLTTNRDDDGWLHTGDLVVVDEAGRLAVVDRIKDLVIVSGFNVHPGEVEAAIRRHDSVAAAAVVGEPDARTGEALVAHVVAAPGATIDEEALAGHCRSELARYKVPHRFEVRDELPTALGGKLKRRDLRQ